MRINIQDIGVLPTNTAAVNGAILEAYLAANPLGVCLWAPKARYPLDREFTHTGDFDYDSDGAIWDFSGASGAIGLTISGALQALPAVAETTYRSNSFVAFASNPELSPADLFILYDRRDYSWSLSRDLYHKGEFCRVREIGSPHVARLVSPLYDTYVPAYTDVYKLVSPRVSIRNLHLVGTNMTGLLRLSLCDSPVLINVTGYHEGYQVVEFDRCYRPKAVNCSLHNKGTVPIPPDEGPDDYGLVITNCQHARVKGGDFYGRRHGIAMGGDSKVGAVIGRDNKIFGATISNDITTNVPAADMHGNLEGCSYIHCTIYGGALLAGRNNGYVGGSITNAAGGWCVYGGEIQGGVMYLRGVTLITNNDPCLNSRGIIDIGGGSESVGSHTQHTLTFSFLDTHLFAENASSSTSFMVMTNRGAAQINIDINIDGLTACGDLGGMGAILRTKRESGGVYSRGFAIRNLSGFPSTTLMHNASDNAYAGVPLTL